MPTANAVLTAIQGILAELGEPETQLHRITLDYFNRGDADQIRILAATNLSDNYCRALGYLVSAKLKPDLPTVAVILAEAARATADHRRDMAMSQLSSIIADSLTLETASAA